MWCRNNFVYNQFQRNCEVLWKMPGETQESPLSFFSIVRLFFEKNLQRISLLIFLMICDWMDEKSQSVSHGPPIRSNVRIFRVL